MKNKEAINMLKDNAELAMAAYGYFHLADLNYKPDKYSKDEKRLQYFRDLAKEKLKEQMPDITDQELQHIYPTPTDILNMEHKYYKDEKTGKLKNGLFDDKFLGGDFSSLQSKRFFEKYDLLKHCPNTESGFSATLFQNKETKEYTLAIRGTEPSDTGDLKTDARMALGCIPQGQYNDMLRFYNQCKTKYPAITESKSLNIVGYSLGGALAQMLTLSLCDNANEANINEVYTFNSHLESKKVAQ